MTLTKNKALLISLGSISTVAVIGISTGVTWAATSGQTISYEDRINLAIRNNLDKLLEPISQNSIVIYSLTENRNNSEMLNRKNDLVLGQSEIKKEDVYAFNLRLEQIRLSKDISFPNDINYQIALDPTKNNLSLLNKGIINIKIYLTHTPTRVSTFKDIELTNFKLPSDKLTKLLDASDSSLKISVKDNSKYITLEELNKKSEEKSELTQESRLMTRMNQTKNDVNGLTKWLQDSFKENEQIKNIHVLGQVRLNKVAKGSDNKTEFYLASSDLAQPLKVVEKDANNNIISEALISEIKTNNLLATDVTVIPSLYDFDASITLLEKLKTNASSNGYSTEINNSNLNRELAVDLMKSDSRSRTSNHNWLFVNPYVINQKLDEKLTNTLPFYLRISFGSGTDLKRYDTANGFDLEELKAAGFSFNFYAKVLMKNDEELKAMDLKNEMKMLDNYFKPQNYSTPAMKENGTPEGSEPKKVKGDFYLTSFPNEQLNSDKPFTISVSEMKGNMMGLANDQKSKAQNLLAFADYSYLGMDQQKVLFTPSITLIYINKEEMNPSSNMERSS